MSEPPASEANDIHISQVWKLCPTNQLVFLDSVMGNKINVLLLIRGIYD